MQQLDKGGYTRQEIINVLHGTYGPRNIKFRYDLLDKNENYKKALLNIESAEIQLEAMADIKRKAKFSILDNGDIDFLNDRIQPFYMLLMPGKSGAPDKWIEWPLGIFLLSTPTRSERNESVYRDVEAYDGIQILYDDKVSSRYTIAAGANYITEIKNVLTGAGITKINIENSAATLTAATEWDPGTEKIKIINALLESLNYTSLWVDESGYFTASKYVSPQNRAAEYDYKNDNTSVTFPGMTEELDLFSVPNKFTVIQSNPETPALVSTYINTNPASQLSTVNRGRTIVDVRTIDNIATQADLDNYAARIAFEASQVYGYIDFETAIMPHHSNFDVYNIINSNLNINDKYSELSWTMPLKAGARMKHKARRVLNV